MNRVIQIHYPSYSQCLLEIKEPILFTIISKIHGGKYMKRKNLPNLMTNKKKSPLFVFRKSTLTEMIVQKCYLQQYPLCEHALYSREFYMGTACIVGGKCPLNCPPCYVGHVHDIRIHSKVHRLDNT